MATELSSQSALAAARGADAEKILIIDDDPPLVAALSQRLRQQGFAVVEAASGAQGRVTAHRDHPDLIVMDLRLPDTDGFTLCQELADAADTCGTPVILLSGMTRPDIIRRARCRLPILRSQALRSRRFNHIDPPLDRRIALRALLPPGQLQSAPPDLSELVRFCYDARVKRSIVPIAVDYGLRTFFLYRRRAWERRNREKGDAKLAARSAACARAFVIARDSFPGFFICLCWPGVSASLSRPCVSSSGRDIAAAARVRIKRPARRTPWTARLRDERVRRRHFCLSPRAAVSLLVPSSVLDLKVLDVPRISPFP